MVSLAKVLRAKAGVVVAVGAAVAVVGAGVEMDLPRVTDRSRLVTSPRWRAIRPRMTAQRPTKTGTARTSSPVLPAPRWSSIVPARRRPAVRQ